MLNFSPEKLFLVGLIALMVLGPNRLPQAARTLGRFMSELRRMSASFQDEGPGSRGERAEPFHSAISDFRPRPDLSHSMRDAITTALVPPTSSGPVPPAGPR